MNMMTFLIDIRNNTSTQEEAEVAVAEAMSRISAGELPTRVYGDIIRRLRAARGE
jgi:hypothetical protein